MMILKHGWGKTVVSLLVFYPHPNLVCRLVFDGDITRFALFDCIILNYNVFRWRS